MTLQVRQPEHALFSRGLVESDCQGPGSGSARVPVPSTHSGQLRGEQGLPASLLCGRLYMPET